MQSKVIQALLETETHPYVKEQLHRRSFCMPPRDQACGPQVWHVRGAKGRGRPVKRAQTLKAQASHNQRAAFPCASSGTRVLLYWSSVRTHSSAHFVTTMAFQEQLQAGAKYVSFCIFIHVLLRHQALLRDLCFPMCA